MPASVRKSLLNGLKNMMPADKNSFLTCSIAIHFAKELPHELVVSQVKFEYNNVPDELCVDLNKTDK